MKKMILFILVLFQFFNSFVVKAESFREEMAYEELYNDIGESQDSLWQERTKRSEDKILESRDKGIAREGVKSKVPMDSYEGRIEVSSSDPNFGNREKVSDSKSFEENLIAGSIEVIDRPENELIGNIDINDSIGQDNFLDRKASEKFDKPIKIKGEILPKYKGKYRTTPLIMNNKNKILELSALNKIKINKNKKRFIITIVKYLLILSAVYVATFIYRKKESKYMFYK